MLFFMGRPFSLQSHRLLFDGKKSDKRVTRSLGRSEASYTGLFHLCDPALARALMLPWLALTLAMGPAVSWSIDIEIGAGVVLW